MNSTQLAVIAIVIFSILIVIAYYLYQDTKFKRIVEDNFNQQTDDIIKENKAIVLDGFNQSTPIQTVLFDDPVLGDANADLVQSEIFIPEDSVEAFFVKVDKIYFPFSSYVDNELDLIIDIVFEESKKFKALPNIEQFTSKPFLIYVLDRDNSWKLLVKGEKIIANALKFVIQLVDCDGIINQAQIANIYNDLYKFVLNNDGHIRHSDYKTVINSIQNKIKHLANIELELEMYLLIKDSIDFKTLSKFFISNGLTVNDGKIFYLEDGIELFVISNEDGEKLQNNKLYSTLLISAKLHFQVDPSKTVEKIFDIVEQFTTQFDSRLLTANKQLFGQKEYDGLQRYINNYVISSKKNDIQLGSKLIWRVCSS